MKIQMKKMYEDAYLPTRATAGAAGYDLYASCVPMDVQSGIIGPGETLKIGTGIAVAIPDGYVGLLFARSGWAIKFGLAPANKVGVIDSDYRGEIVVALHNHSDKPRAITRGSRVAQLVIVPAMAVDFEVVDELPNTERGEGGLGSTGR